MSKFIILIATILLFTPNNTYAQSCWSDADCSSAKPTCSGYALPGPELPFGSQGQCAVATKAPIGSPCNSPAQCESGVCSANLKCVQGQTQKAGEECFVDANCQVGLVCQKLPSGKGACFKALPLGASCKENKDCQSGSCEKSICTSGGEKYVPPIAPKLQIPIPNLKLTDVFTPVQEGTQRVLYIPTIAEYAAGLYKYLVSIAGILAGIMIVWAGVKWLMAAGNAEMISDAKHKIGGAIIGIILAVGSYIILYLVNPDLVTFKSLRIPLIAREEFVFDETGGDTEAGLQATTQDAQALGFYCPGSGGAGAITQIIDSMKGKVAYRFGGKGKKGPPFDFGETKPELLKYDNNCPAGNACLDCSGFVNYVYKCAGLPTINGGTKTIFGGSEAINTIDWENNSVNGTPLKAGDLLGLMEGEGGHEIGHVKMYIGNGQLAESAGQAEKGRQPGANPKITPLSQNKKYPFKHIRRLP